MEPRTIEIGLIQTERMRELLTSRKFLEALAFAADITDETGHETGLNMFLVDGELAIDAVSEGLTDSMEGAEDVLEIDEHIPEDPLWVSSLHFHPTTEIPSPSHSDLRALLFLPTIAVAAVDGNWVGVNILSRKPFFSVKNIAEYERNRHLPPEEINLNSAVLHYERQNRALMPRDLSQLSQLGSIYPAHIFFDE